MSLLRKTTQNPLPVCKPETGKNQYDIYPTHDLGPDKIFCDYTSLARRLAGQKQVVVDGYVGVRFDLFRQELNRALTQLGIRPVWWSVDAALRPQEEIERLVAPYLGGDDPIFGFRTPLRLEEFFDGEKLRAIAPDPEAEMNILVGTGAALAGWQGELVYIDIPKNEIQFRSRAGSIANLGATQPEPTRQAENSYAVFCLKKKKKHARLQPPARNITHASAHSARLFPNNDQNFTDAHPSPPHLTPQT